MTGSMGLAWLAGLRLRQGVLAGRYQRLVLVGLLKRRVRQLEWHEIGVFLSFVVSWVSC